MLDEGLPDAIHLCGIYGLILVATTVTVAVNIPYVAAFSALILAATAAGCGLYLPAANQLRRSRARAKAQLLTLTTELLEGLDVVQVGGGGGLMVVVVVVVMSRGRGLMGGASVVSQFLG